MKLTLQQVARALDSPQETIERWVRQGRIPIAKNGNEYSLNIKTLEKWATQRKLPFVLPTNCNESPPPPAFESLLDAMRIGKICQATEGNDAKSALTSAVNCVPGLSSNEQLELYHRLLERESLASTGIGKGIAIPHPRTPLSQRLEHSQITTCFLKEPVDFNAIDDKPVFVFFILLSPSVKHHLHLISRLSFCLRNDKFVSFLRQKPQAQAILQKIADFESALDQDS